MKRIFDLGVGVFLLIFLAPIMILVALLIRIDSKGTVIFKQKRVGKNGEIFTMYKFRSMRLNAEISGPYYTKPKDPRITRVGKFIRKTSLDELPQIFNVIKGNMSLVGPRPNVSVQKKEYTQEEWEKRNMVKPGITGLAQAKLRSIASAEERKSLDLEYVDQTSFSYDIWIILITIRQIILQGGN